MSVTCEIPDEIREEFKKFKLTKNSGEAVLMKINKDKLIVEIENRYKDTKIEDIANDLPESAPRFIAYSYKYTHEDGRFSMPLVFVFYCPPDINPSLAMMYSSTKTRLLQATQIQKTFDIQDPEALNEDWLKEKLKFFK